MYQHLLFQPEQDRRVRLPEVGPVDILRELPLSTNLHLDRIDNSRTYQSPALLRIIDFLVNTQEGNAAIHAPPGAGKLLLSIISALSSKGSRVILTTPFSHLVDQYSRDWGYFVRDIPLERCDGEISPTKRASLYAENANKYFVTSPQALANDLQSGALTVEPRHLLIADEIHQSSLKQDSAGTFYSRDGYSVAIPIILQQGARLLALSATSYGSISSLRKFTDKHRIVEHIHVQMPVKPLTRTRITVETDTVSKETHRHLSIGLSQALRDLHAHLIDMRDHSSTKVRQSVKALSRQLNSLSTTDEKYDVDKLLIERQKLYRNIQELKAALSTSGDKTALKKISTLGAEIGLRAYLSETLLCHGKAQFLEATIAQLFEVFVEGAEIAEQEKCRRSIKKITKQLVSELNSAEGTLDSSEIEYLRAATSLVYRRNGIESLQLRVDLNEIIQTARERLTEESFARIHAEIEQRETHFRSEKSLRAILPLLIQLRSELRKYCHEHSSYPNNEEVRDEFRVVLSQLYTSDVITKDERTHAYSLFHSLPSGGEFDTPETLTARAELKQFLDTAFDILRIKMENLTEEILHSEDQHSSEASSELNSICTLSQEINILREFFHTEPVMRRHLSKADVTTAPLYLQRIATDGSFKRALTVLLNAVEDETGSKLPAVHAFLQGKSIAVVASLTPGLGTQVSSHSHIRQQLAEYVIEVCARSQSFVNHSKDREVLKFLSPFGDTPFTRSLVHFPTVSLAYFWQQRFNALDEGRAVEARLFVGSSHMTARERRQTKEWFDGSDDSFKCLFASPAAREGLNFSVQGVLAYSPLFNETQETQLVGRAGRVLAKDTHTDFPHSEYVCLSSSTEDMRSMIVAINTKRAELLRMQTADELV